MSVGSQAFTIRLFLVNDTTVTSALLYSWLVETGMCQACPWVEGELGEDSDQLSSARTSAESYLVWWALWVPGCFL